MQVVEWPAHPHFHAATQVNKCRSKRYCPRNPDASSVINRSPLSDRGWCEGDTDQDCTIRWINRSLLHFPWARTQASHGELWLLVGASCPALVGRRTKNICQRQSIHSCVLLRATQRSSVAGIPIFQFR